MKKRILLLVGIFGAAIVGASFNFGGEKASATVPGTNTLASINRNNSSATSTGTDSNGGVLSADGKYMIFRSGATNVVYGDTNGQTDVFRRDLSAQTTTLESKSSAGAQANGDIRHQAISRTGRYILMTSVASNLIDGSTITTTKYQLYLRDTVAGTTELLSKNSAGDLADQEITGLDVSSDGRFILFKTHASNLNPDATNGQPNLYLLDRDDDSFTILNYRHDGTLSSGYAYTTGRMSCDGSLIAIRANGLTAGSSNHSHDIYLYDRRSGNKITNLTENSNTNGAGSPSVSCNGDFVGFTSSANNLDPTVSSAVSVGHVYAYDRVSNVFTMLDKTTANTPGQTDIHQGPCDIAYTTSCVQISDDGLAAFISSSSNLLGGTPISKTQVYIRNLATGNLELLTRDASGNPGNKASIWPSISTNGSIVGYGSQATNLVTTTDANNFTDAFVSLTGL